MFRVFAAAVRAFYLSAAGLAPPFLVWWLVNSMQTEKSGLGRLIAYLATVIIFVLIYGAMPAAAWLRIARREGMLPDAHLRARPVTAAFVALVSALGSLSFLSLMYFEACTRDICHEGASVLPLITTIFMYAIALAAGELLLMRRLSAAAS
jgi:hypothetical protein